MFYVVYFVVPRQRPSANPAAADHNNNNNNDLGSVLLPILLQPIMLRLNDTSTSVRACVHVHVGACMPVRARGRGMVHVWGHTRPFRFAAFSCACRRFKE